MSGTGDIEYSLLDGVKHNIGGFVIGDRVKLIEDSKNIIYTVYAITQYATHKTYTIWNGEDYHTVEEWQINRYYPSNYIGFIPTIGAPV